MAVLPDIKVRYLHDLKDTVKRAVRLGAEEWVKAVAESARRLTPRKTGAAGDSLEGEVQEKDGEELLLSVTSDIPYFGILEYGSVAHIIEAKPGGVLAFKVAGEAIRREYKQRRKGLQRVLRSVKTGRFVKPTQWVYTMRVHHPGTPEFAPVRKAMLMHAQDLGLMVSSHLEFEVRMKELTR